MKSFLVEVRIHTKSERKKRLGSKKEKDEKDEKGKTKKNRIYIFEKRNVYKKRGTN